MLDLHRLALLREVKLRGSITAAARELSYTHSAVSQQLTLLEHETGVVLLERVGRGVRLTAAGEELARNTEPILAAVERAEADLAASQRRPRGIIRVAAFATISRDILPRASAALARDAPELDVRIRLAEPEVAVAWLTARQIDVALTDAYPGTAQPMSAGIHVTTLGQDPVRVYLPDPSIEELANVRDVPWVTEPIGSAATEWLLRVCRERGFEPVLAHESSDLLFHLRMVERGCAAAFIPDMVVREAGSALVESRWLLAGHQRTVHLLVRDGAETRPSIVAVHDAVKTAFDSAYGPTPPTRSDAAVDEMAAPSHKQR